MPTLRQHFARAMEILSTHGVRTILPSGDVAVRKRSWKRKWMRGPKRPATRPDVAGNQRDYALSVKIVCEAHDRTGWLVRWLEASDDTASSVWNSIPDRIICFDCRVERRIPECSCKGTTARCRCRDCPKCRRRMATYSGVVSADAKKAAARLTAGKIPTAGGRGWGSYARPAPTRQDGTGPDRT